MKTLNESLVFRRRSHRLRSCRLILFLLDSADSIPTAAIASCRTRPAAHTLRSAGASVLGRCGFNAYTESLSKITCLQAAHGLLSIGQCDCEKSEASDARSTDLTRFARWWCGRLAYFVGSHALQPAFWFGWRLRHRVLAEGFGRLN